MLAVVKHCMRQIDVHVCMHPSTHVSFQPCSDPVPQMLLAHAHS